jgi:flavin reductase (DIM6/NTAB) family NADH-FMN oxidoreductase RutF
VHDHLAAEQPALVHGGRPLTTTSDAAADDDTLRDRLDDVLGGGDPPVVVVTARGDDDRIAGCLVGFTSQCGIKPARFAVWLSVRNHTYAVARTSRYLAVHVLTPANRALAELFGSATGHDHDKFAECVWSPGPHGLPILADSGGWFAGPAEHHTTSGDHALFIVTPDAVSGRIVGKPLSFQEVRHIEAGNPA